VRGGDRSAPLGRKFSAGGATSHASYVSIWGGGLSVRLLLVRPIDGDVTLLLQDARLLCGHQDDVTAPVSRKRLGCSYLCCSKEVQ
jgi:hypothetical protein